MKYLSILILLLVSLASCNKKTSISNEKTSLNKKTTKAIFNAWEEGSFTTLKAKLNLSINSPDLNQSGQSRIYMESGQRMWMNVSKFGFEVARVMITRDSFYMMNKLNREYAIIPISELTAAYGLPSEYDKLERLIIGKAPVKDLDKMTIVDNEGKFLMTGFDKKQPLFLTYMILAQNYAISQISITDNNGLKAKVEQNDFQDIKNYKFFPYLRTYDVTTSGGEHYKLDLKFSEVICDESVNMPFNIPKNYTKTRIL